MCPNAAPGDAPPGSASGVLGVSGEHAHRCASLGQGGCYSGKLEGLALSARAGLLGRAEPRALAGAKGSRAAAALGPRLPGKRSGPRARAAFAWEEIRASRSRRVCLARHPGRRRTRAARSAGHLPAKARGVAAEGERRRRAGGGRRRPRRGRGGLFEAPAGAREGRPREARGTRARRALPGQARAPGVSIKIASCALPRRRPCPNALPASASRLAATPVSCRPAASRPPVRPESGARSGRVVGAREPHERLRRPGAFRSPEVCPDFGRAARG